MEFRDGWDKSKERILAFWNREIIDRCCISVMSPKKGKTWPEEPQLNSEEDLIRYWTDGEWILERKLKEFENTFFGGECFPQLFVNLGAGGHGGFFKDISYKFKENTVWFFPFIEDWEKDASVFDPDSFLYRKTIELAKYFVQESKGRYYVSMPDTCGNADALAHMRGSENLLMDMVLEKEHVHAALDIIQKVWEKTVEEVYNIVKDNNDGGCTIGWLDIWGPGRFTQMQSDISVMISPDQFNEFIMPELKSQISWMDHSLYHFDGLEQIRHLDMLLSLENLDVIQWTCVAGQPSPLEFIHIFKKIQAAGKCLLLYATPKEIEVLLQELSSKGLYLVARVDSEDEARDLIKMAEKLSHE